MQFGILTNDGKHQSTISPTQWLKDFIKLNPNTCRWTHEMRYDTMSGALSVDKR